MYGVITPYMRLATKLPYLLAVPEARFRLLFEPACVTLPAQLDLLGETFARTGCSKFFRYDVKIAPHRLPTAISELLRQPHLGKCV